MAEVNLKKSVMHNIQPVRRRLFPTQEPNLIFQPQVSSDESKEDIEVYGAPE